VAGVSVDEVVSETVAGVSAEAVLT